ncbi:MAG: hypothetical protein A2Y93_00805 [Chloroflexi bacterium RBG_13_68_17]|nr:MAG: hypothetical protein A2Y93_00805 [Chloroflexi bacterium RBG_13_68_17]
MRTLLRTLQDYDPGFLRIIAELWGVDLPSLPAPQTAEALAAAMLQPGAARDLLEGLPLPAQRTIHAVAAHDRRISMADLVRRFGPLREMGPGRRDRERPWREPASPVEMLWYRGWLGRAFADTPAGPQEFAYIPEELADRIPVPDSASVEPRGRPAPEPAWVNAGTGAAVDDATTLLAALRRRGARSLPLPEPRQRDLKRFLLQPDSAEMLLTLLREAGLLSGAALQPPPEAARAFLEASRADALITLQQTWRETTAWNDLAHVADLAAPGGRWPNDPRLARRALLHHLQPIPGDAWWDLSSWIEAVHETEPAFQRPGGDFDSWYVTDRRTGAYLQGFSAWPAIEGALLRFLITGPLHWIGIVDLGAASPDTPADCFRRAPWGARLFDSLAPNAEDDPPALAALRQDGHLIVPAMVPRGLRYQIARCCAWVGRDAQGFHYRLTPDGLRAAHEQGLQVGHVRSILEAATGRKVPAPHLRAIERVGSANVEARLERPLVLRVKSAAILRELQSHPATARFLKDPLGPTAVRVDERDWERLCAAALRAGLLIEPPSASDAPPTP